MNRYAPREALGREEIAWGQVIAVLGVGKFCGRASELGIAEEWYARTALEDISGIPAEAVNAGAANGPLNR